MCVNTCKNPPLESSLQANASATNRSICRLKPLLQRLLSIGTEAEYTRNVCRFLA